MAEVKAGPAVAADVDPATANVPVGGYVCSPDKVSFHDRLKVTTLKQLLMLLLVSSKTNSVKNNF